MPHDFKAFPELTNSQMQFYYFDSPHKQIFESFTAQVANVHDGDTISVRWNERDFVFPVRFSNIAAPETGGKKGLQAGGTASREWLSNLLMGKTIDVVVDPANRVEKWGRLLGRVYLSGVDVGNESILLGHSVAWNDRNQGQIIDPIGEVGKWL